MEGSWKREEVKPNQNLAAGSVHVGVANFVETPLVPAIARPLSSAVCVVLPSTADRPRSLPAGQSWSLLAAPSLHPAPARQTLSPAACWREPAPRRASFETRSQPLDRDGAGRALDREEPPLGTASRRRQERQAPQAGGPAARHPRLLAAAAGARRGGGGRRRLCVSGLSCTLTPLVFSISITAATARSCRQ